jgi:hypothetical protein
MTNPRHKDHAVATACRGWAGGVVKLGTGGTHQCPKTLWKSQIIRESWAVSARVAKSVMESRFQQSPGDNTRLGNYTLGVRILTRPIIADSMDAEMWYPNKSQSWVIWIVFVVASFFFLAPIWDEKPEGPHALAFCVLVLGGLLVWRFNKKS